MTSTTELAALMPIVVREARRLVARLPASVEMDDMVSVGTWAAYESISAHGDSPLGAYATIRIRGAMLDELRRMDPLTRNQRAGGMVAQVAGEEALEALADPSMGPDELADRRRRARRAVEVIEGLPERLHSVVEMHHEQGLDFTEIAAALGVSVPQVSRRHAEAVAAIRRAFRE